MINDLNYLLINKNNKTKYKLKIIIICFIMFLIFTFFYKLNMSNFYVARFIKNDNYNMQVYLPMSDLSFIENKKLIIDNHLYDYKIINIEDSNNNFFVVDILVDLNSSLIDENYISVKQNVSNKSLFNVIVEKIKKGLI